MSTASIGKSWKCMLFGVDHVQVSHTSTLAESLGILNSSISERDESHKGSQIITIFFPRPNEPSKYLSWYLHGFSVLRRPHHVPDQ